jgi:hypothetical protein
MKCAAPRMTAVLAAGLLAAALATGTVTAAHAAADGGYTPSVGQEGKDVIWVPTPQALVERMLTMAEVKPTDFVVDLGSGDGRTVITAVKKFGARALGLEYNADMVELSRRNAEKEGVSDRAQFQRTDIFTTDFSNATVVTMYLLPSLNLKLRPTLLNMKPGTRVVSHAFSMDNWTPDETADVEGRTAYLWIIPAKVEGNWRVEVAGAAQGRYDLNLRQRFQMLEGSARNASQALEVRDGRVRGEEVTFTLVEGSAARVFTGRFAGERLEGSIKGGDAKWAATRVK